MTECFTIRYALGMTFLCRNCQYSFFLIKCLLNVEVIVCESHYMCDCAASCLSDITVLFLFKSNPIPLAVDGEMKCWTETKLKLFSDFVY